MGPNLCHLKVLLLSLGVIVSEVTPGVQQPFVYQLEEEASVWRGREGRRKAADSLVIDWPLELLSYVSFEAPHFFVG